MIAPPRPLRRHGPLALAVVLVLAAACNQVLGIRDVELDRDGPPRDVPDDAACTSGLCCAEGELLPPTIECMRTTEYHCEGACGAGREERVVKQFCSGTSADCTGDRETESRPLTACTSDELCHGADDATFAECIRCPRGCEAGACRDGELWIYATTGGYRGHLGGGSGGRARADAICLASYRARFVEQGLCSEAHVHALLGVSPEDQLRDMPVTWGVPDDVPVLRATDQAQVAAHWGDLTDPGVQLDRPVVGSPEVFLDFWTGWNLNATCNGWTSQAAGVSGRWGDAARRQDWLSQGTGACDESRNLVCLCWSAP
jgi:hypothetical protein